MTGSLKKNQLIEIKIEDLNNLGYGVGRIGGLVCFVQGAVDGDLVLARVLRVTATYAVAKLERLLSPSPHRIENDCPSRACGGCAYRSVSYEHELCLKRGYVEAAFRKAGLPCAEVLETLSTGKTEGYRNKAQYPIAVGGGSDAVIGFFAPRSHRVVEASDCRLQPKVFFEIIGEVREWISLYRIPIYDEEKQTGLLRHLYLRTSADGGEILLTLVVNGGTLPHSDELIARLRASFDSLVGVVLNRNEENTNVILGDTYRLLWGRDYIEDTLCGVRLRLHPAAFYQVNHDATELLYRTAAELAELRGDELLLDLFCGVGSIGLSMAGRVRELVGIEIVPEAVACAAENAARCGIRNAHFYVGDAADTERLLENAEAELGRSLLPDVVILDPPRKGADAELLRFLARRGIPKIVYISCNPDTLARDVSLLSSLGYAFGKITPVDLFPRTGHVESLVCLQKQTN